MTVGKWVVGGETQVEEPWFGWSEAPPKGSMVGED